MCRHVRLLASERGLAGDAAEYDVPVLGRTRLTLQVSRSGDESQVALRSRSGLLVVTKRGREPRSFEGDRALLTKIARRELDFLLSARPADRPRVRACARSLGEAVDPSARPCCRIDWREICDAVENQGAPPC
jgi:hypothetical protein